MKIKFNPKIFNPLYWHIRYAFTCTFLRFIWLYGGSSAAKTYSLCQCILVDMMSKGSNTMIFRKFSTDIDNSIYADVKGIIERWKLKDQFICIKHKIIYKPNGSYIVFKGLDDSEKIKGLSQFKRIVLEEASQFDETDLKQIRKRLRGIVGQQIIGVFNPIDEEHWIKVNVFDNLNLQEADSTDILEDKTVKLKDWQVKISGKYYSEKKNAMVCKVTYLDNWYVVGHPSGKGGFVDQHTIDDFEYDKKHDYEYYRIYALGEWGKIRTGGEFYKDFRPEIHVDDAVEYNPALPLHINFDENVNPYITMTITQVKGTDIKVIDEICLPDPKNTLRHLCNEFTKRYHNHTNGVYMYGDATSRKADTKLEKGSNFYTLVIQYLKQFRPVLRLPKANPSVMMRGLFVNSVLREEFDGIRILISPKCKKTIDDFSNVKEAPDGTKFKEKVKDPKTGIRYEKYGHCTDTFDYFICQAFAKSFLKFQKGDKKIKFVTSRPKASKSY